MTTVAERLEHVKQAPRSVSQYQQYMKCPYQYYLQRVEQVWEKPAAWLPQGLAVHEAGEAHERSGRTLTLDQAQEVYSESYAKHTNRLSEDTPNKGYWFRSGPYDGWADTDRRYDLGMNQVGRYLDYYEEHPDEVIWTTPEGEPAIELGFNIDLDGVAVRGYIDAVIQHPNYGVIVRDTKSGNKPGDAFQLATYGEGIHQTFGQPVAIGDYWMGRNGKPTVPYKLHEWGTDTLAREFKKMDEGVKAEQFDPDPEPKKCDFCPVKASCSFFAQ